MRAFPQKALYWPGADKQTSAAQASQSFTDPEPIDTKNDLMKDGQMMKEKC